MKKTGGTKKWGEHRTRIIKLNIKFAVKTWAIRGKRRAKCWAGFRRIENGGFVPRSDEVLEMSRGYRNPNLCNYYCAHECPIGQQYVPEIKVKDLSRIVLEMLASLNAMQKKQERLIEITADGQISEDEMIDFTGIQAELEKISVTVETLQFWFEQMVADGEIKLQKNYCEAEK